MHKIDNALSRSMIWYQLFYHINDMQMTSRDYIDFAITQIPHETSAKALQKTLFNLKSAIHTYSPPKMVQDYQSNVFQSIVHILNNPKIDSTTRGSVLDRAFDFLMSKKDIDLALSWMNDNKFELNKQHKSGILAAVCRSADYKGDFRQDLTQKVLGDDQDDIAISIKLSCEAAVPDKAQKETIWKQLLGFDDAQNGGSNKNAQVQKFSMQQLSAKIGGFYQWGQEDILKPYMDQYYSIIQDPRLYQNQGYKYLQNLIAGLLPVERVVT